MHTKIEFTDSVTVLYSPLYENGGFADYAKKLRFDGGRSDRFSTVSLNGVLSSTG